MTLYDRVAATPAALTVRVHDEGPDGLWAEVEQRPGVFASGHTAAELAVSLREALALTDGDVDGEPEP